jgi:hypothetical protein
MRLSLEVSHSEYRESFLKNAGKLRRELLVKGIEEVGPYLDPTVKDGHDVPWLLEWAFVFPGGFHWKVTEYYSKRAGKEKGIKANSSFHYGKTSRHRDPYNFPEHLKSGCVIRIDDSEKDGPHLHYQGIDHIPQTKVDGLDIQRFDLFDFIRAVHVHRERKVPFHELLRFKVVK